MSSCYLLWRLHHRPRIREIEAAGKQVFDGFVDVPLRHRLGLHPHHVGQVLLAHLELGPLLGYEGVMFALLLEVELHRHAQLLLGLGRRGRGDRCRL